MAKEAERETRRVVGFPVPDLVDPTGGIVKYTPETHVGAGAYRPVSARGGRHDAMDIYSEEFRTEGKIRIGSDVVAIANATARFFPNSVGGNAIRITFYGDDGKRYTADYRHLAAVSSKLMEKDKYGRYMEVKVEKGDVLGQVGNSGNVVNRGIPYPILCFAMTCNGKPIDPYKVFFKIHYSPPRVAMNLGEKVVKSPLMKL